MVYSKFKKERKSQLMFDILVVSLPLCVNGFLSTTLNTVSTLIVPRRLISTGIKYSEALSLIGKFSSMAMSIITFPMIIIGSISTVLIPDLSQALDKKDYLSMENRIIQVLRISFLLGLATLVISISIPNSLGKLFFGRDDLGSYIKFAAIAAPLTYVSSTTYGILNGLGRQGILLRNSLLVSVEEVILLYIFTGIPSINIFGFGITLIITSTTTFLINIYEIKKYCYINFSFSEIFIYILFSILIYFIINIANNLIPNKLFTLKNLFIIFFTFASFLCSISVISKKESLI